MSEKEKLLSQLKNQKYISVITYRKNGDAVPTPIWFVEETGKLYLCTPEISFKVRRIKNNPKVQVAVCGTKGKVKGDYFNATAGILSSKETGPIIQLFREKYRFFRLWNSFSNMRKKKKHVYIEIIP